MTTAIDFEREKLELEAILSSGIFSRAPSLGHLLAYICSKYFEGAGDELKEYNIAVEALGRPAGFDQKKDSIVRVEAHRLRKRLREYYAAEGANHGVRIVIPAGQYAPTFEYQESAMAAEAAVSEPPPAEPESIALPKHPWSSEIRLLPAILALLAACLLFAALYIRSARARVAAFTSQGVAAAGQPSDDVRILAGADRGNYTDVFGHTWQSDRFFDGGAIFHLNDALIANTRDPRIFQNRREGIFRYDIPLKAGVYEMRLYFAETVYGESNIAGGGEASRVFNVLVNGATILPFFDAIGDVGPSAADIRVFKNISPAADGKLHLSFAQVTNVPFLNGIEITAGEPGRMRPIRMLARDRAYAALDGLIWEPDRIAKGGQLMVRPDPVSGADDPQLFRGERFGNLNYAIPVADGRYAVTLYFAESWFGPNRPGSGGVGSRLFDILCNGVALARNVDVLSEAGGPERVVRRTFHGLIPNHQGKLAISLVPVRNYAFLNALEVVDESK